MTRSALASGLSVALVAVAVVAGTTSSDTDAAKPKRGSLEATRVLSYPASYVDPTSKLKFTGPVAGTPGQLTTAMPRKDKIDAVTFIVYWSQIEPRRGDYRWDKIDQVVDYWRARGKKVVLNPVTYAVPRRFGQAWGGQIENGLPDWLRKRARTLPAFKLPLLGSGKNSKGYPMYVPVPWDETFRSRYARLIRKMGARYDGNPGVEFVRIGTGKYGEEIYPYGCSGVVPKKTCADAARIGWTPKRWYAYTTWISKVYRKSFTKSRLSINLSFAGIFLNPQHRWYKDHRYARAFLRYLRSSKIMIGTNGMRAESLRQIQDEDYRGNRIAQILTKESRAGRPVEFEQYHPINNPEMADAAAVRKALQLMRPRYVNFFGTTLAQDQYLTGNRSNVSVSSWRQLVSGLDGSESVARERATAYHGLLEDLW